jgi:exonuclease VII large subunit
MSEDAQVEVIRSEVKSVVDTAKAMQVSSPAQYQGAADYLKAIKAAQKKVVDHFAGMKEAAHKAWKTITAQEADTLKPLAEAEGLLKRSMLTYQTEQEAIRQAEQRRLQAVADELARKEREKSEAAARLQREKEQAALREAEEARRRAQEATNEAARAKAAAEAEKAQAAANRAAAAAQVREETAAAVIAPVVQVASVTPVVSGQSIRKTWRARVVNQALVPREWLVVNQQALDSFAKATSGGVAVAGVEMYQETTLASSSK